MHGINLQLFNSKLRISIFDNLPKKLHLRKLRKKNSAKPRKTHCVSCAKIAQKFGKKISSNFAQFSHFVETLNKCVYRFQINNLKNIVEIFCDQFIYSGRRLIISIQLKTTFDFNFDLSQTFNSMNIGIDDKSTFYPPMECRLYQTLLSAILRQFLCTPTKRKKGKQQLVSEKF